MSPKITSLPCHSSGTIGIGGQGMTLAIVDSSSGASSARVTNRSMISAFTGRNSIPPTTWGSSATTSSGKRRRRRLPAADVALPPSRAVATSDWS